MGASSSAVSVPGSLAYQDGEGRSAQHVTNGVEADEQAVRFRRPEPALRFNALKPMKSTPLPSEQLARHTDAARAAISKKLKAAWKRRKARAAKATSLVVRGKDQFGKLVEELIEPGTAIDELRERESARMGVRSAPRVASPPMGSSVAAPSATGGQAVSGLLGANGPAASTFVTSPSSSLGVLRNLHREIGIIRSILRGMEDRFAKELDLPSEL